MKLRDVILLLIVVSLIVGFMVSNHLNLLVLTCPSNYIDETLEKKFGPEKFYEIYDYKYVTLGKVIILRPYSEVTASLPVYDGDSKSKFAQIVDYMRNFTYTQNQPNPNLVYKDGGNCQALSILFKKICLANSIDCYLAGSKTHVYDIVVVDGSKYNVDLSNSTIEKEDN